MSRLERPALQVIRATSDVKLAHLADPAEALCKLGNATSHSVKVHTGWSFMRKYIKMFVSTLHTLKSQAGAAEGGDPVLGASEVASSVVVDGMDCVRLAKCVSALEEKKDLLKVASAFMAENALPLASHQCEKLHNSIEKDAPSGRQGCVRHVQVPQQPGRAGPVRRVGRYTCARHREARWRWNRISLAAGCDETRRAHLQPAA